MAQKTMKVVVGYYLVTFLAVVGHAAPNLASSQTNTSQEGRARDDLVKQLQSMISSKHEQSTGGEVTETNGAKPGPAPDSVPGKLVSGSGPVRYDPSVLAMFKDLIEGVELAVENGRKGQDGGSPDQVVQSAIDVESETKQNPKPNQNAGKFELTEASTTSSADHSRLDVDGQNGEVGQTGKSSIEPGVNPVSQLTNSVHSEVNSPKPSKRHPSLDIGRMNYGLPFEASLMKKRSRHHKSIAETKSGI